jgi:hypothetical protein
MKKCILLLFTICCVNSYSSENSDTIIQTVPKQYRLIKGKWGAVAFLGGNGINYDNKTTQWIPNHIGFCFDIGLIYTDFTLFGEFRPYTANGNNDIKFGNDTLFHYWRFNDININLIITYEKYILSRLSVEPFLGLNRNHFVFVDENVAKKDISIPTATGLLIGSYINLIVYKDIRFTIPIRFGIRYCLIDYSTVHPSLGHNYWAWDICLGMKEKSVKMEPIYNQ